MIRTIANAYRAAYSGLPRESWLLSLVLLVNRAGSMVLPFLGLYLIREQGLSVAQAGRVLALYGVGAMAGTYLGGWLSDRIGATRTQQVSLLFSGFGYLWIVVIEDPRWLAPAVFVLAILVESFRPAVMADVAERSPREAQLRSFALLRLAANLGIGLGPAVGGYLALFDYRLLFVADALTCWLACGLLARLLDPVAGERATREARRRGPSPWRDLPFVALMALVVALAAALFQVWSTLPVDLRERLAFREDTIGLLLALNPLLIVLFEMLLIRWAERRARLPLVALGALLLCVGLGMLPLGGSVAFVAASIAVWTLGEMLALPLVNGIVADRAAPGTRGRYMGIYSSAFSLAFVIAPAVGMHVYQAHGPDALWYGVGLLGPLLAAGALFLARPLAKTLAGAQVDPDTM